MNVGNRANHWHLHTVLLVAWFAASFGVVFFAHDLQWVVAGAVLAAFALLLFAFYLYLRCWVVVNTPTPPPLHLILIFSSV